MIFFLLFTSLVCTNASQTPLSGIKNDGFDGALRRGLVADAVVAS